MIMLVLNDTDTSQGLKINPYRNDVQPIDLNILGTDSTDTSRLMVRQNSLKISIAGSIPAKRGNPTPCK